MAKKKTKKKKEEEKVKLGTLHKDDIKIDLSC